MNLRAIARLAYGVCCAAPILAGALHIGSVLWKVQQGILADKSSYSQSTLILVGVGLIVCGALALLALPHLKRPAPGPAPVLGCVFLLAVVLGICLGFDEYRGLPLAAFPVLAGGLVVAASGKPEAG